MQKQLAIMLDLQDKMNKKVHSDWIAQDFAWFRAIWIECGELVDHYGYKWWKKQQPDMAQVQLEIVDIWHFGLSMLMDGREHSEIANEIAEQLVQQPEKAQGVIEATETLAESILATRAFDVVKFWQLLQVAEMDFDELFKQYVGKNVLNFFRQDHGYKDGSYVKVWHGREDNEHLSEIMNQQTHIDEHLADVLYQSLETIYNKL